MPLGRRLTILLKVLGVFLLMGPPVGGLTFFAGIGVYGASQTGDIADIGWITLFGLIYGLPLGYLVGLAPAAVGASGLHRGLEQGCVRRQSCCLEQQGRVGGGVGGTVARDGGDVAGVGDHRGHATELFELVGH